MSKDELIFYIKGFIAAYYNGSQKDFAENNNMSSAYVSDVLLGKRSPGEKVLNAVGVERVITYKLKESND